MPVNPTVQCNVRNVPSVFYVHSRYIRAFFHIFQDRAVFLFISF